MTPERIADHACETGEGPLWHPDHEVLYWVDIPRGNLFAHDPATGDDECVLDVEVAIGGFTIEESGALLLFGERGTVRPWTREEGLGDAVVDAIAGEERSRFNDVIADPRGRVFCGTMPTDEQLGTLYRLDPDGSIRAVIEGVDVPNGMGFTPDRRRLYVTESEASTIYRYDYDQATGALSNRETFVDASDEAGIPDGMTVDAEGYVWSAYWDGGYLVRYDPTGREVARVAFPARKVSAVTFGGPEYADCYVTTALGPAAADGTEHVTDAAAVRDTEGDGAGALFRLDTGVVGVPEFRSRVL
jgi:sugar lactone lactonase YvrE